MTYGQPFVGTVSCNVVLLQSTRMLVSTLYDVFYFNLKDSGPSLLRAQGLVRELGNLGWEVEDIPDLDFSTICARSETLKQPSIYAPQVHNR